MLLETISKLATGVFSHVSVPVHELSPQRHVPESALRYVGGRQIRLWKEAAIRTNVVQPRGSDDSDWRSTGPLNVSEEGRKFRAPPIANK